MRIAEIRSSNDKPEVASYSTAILKMFPGFHDYNIESPIEYLKKNGLSLSEFGKVVEKYEEQILQKLADLLDRSGYMSAEIAISTLSHLGMFKEEVQAMLNDKKDKIVLDYLVDIMNTSPGAAYTTVFDHIKPILEIAGLGWPEIFGSEVAAFNKHKKEIVRHLLYTMQEEDGLEDVEIKLQNIENAGIDWPELAIIRKSIDSDKRAKQ